MTETVELPWDVMVNLSLGRSRVDAMEHSQDETSEASKKAVRLHEHGEPLAPAAAEALNRRTPEEHQAAIDRALRRR
jgi:hypothetical protein